MAPDGQSLGRAPRPRYACAMCRGARLSSDVSEIRLVFFIPPDRPIPNAPPSWNQAPTDSGSRWLCETNKPHDARDHHRTPKR
jgi:hypothetical protein